MGSAWIGFMTVGSMQARLGQEIILLASSGG